MERSDKSAARAERIARYSASVGLHEENPRHKPIFDRLKALHEGDKDARRIAKKANQRASALAACYRLNGPGIFIDRYLRDFLMEYNGRLFQGQGDKQPNSFNILNAFVEPDEKSLVLRLLPEKHYSLNLDRILESLTDPSSDHMLSSLIDVAEELTVFEYHVAGGYTDITLGSFPLTFHGAAFVREGSELSIVSLFGRKVDKLSVGKIDQADMKTYPGKSFLEEMGEIDISDIEIIEGSNMVPLIVMSRIDVKEGAAQARYILHEKKDNFDVITDDPNVLNDMRIMGMDDIAIASSLERLIEYLPIIEFVEQIPRFQNRLVELDDEVSIVRYPTQLRTESKSSVAKKIKKALSIAEVDNYVDVASLDVEVGSGKEYAVSPQNLKIESRGYWKTLAATAHGKDRNGNEIFGKTWVEVHESWYETTHTKSKVYKPINVTVGKSSDIGTVYVLRNAQHPRNTFKIGFTTKEAEDRAGQLSGTSGQPDGFAVVQDWLVYNPRAIEFEVHKRLSRFRVNKRREFFQVDYREIRSCIEEVLTEASAEISEN
ncbi:GIY-YIG nuclease family protein [Qipengyuania sp. SM2507]